MSTYRSSNVEGLDSGELEYTHVVATVTAAGPTTIYTPAAGKQIQLRWIYAVTNPGSSVFPLIKVFLGSEEKFRVFVLSKRQNTAGPIDGPLIIDLSDAAEVAVTAILEEI